ncbi:sigma-70 family RNA polymerase sigma factor [Streptomyces sp. NPDC049555]|uniref:RNA polymerase sigma factor n=1 Tax=unclassified Streptomyces TaxID=2593676 RepID=UPI003436DE5D
MDLDDGFVELVRVHGSAIRTYLLRLTGSPAEADDLGQDTFLRAYVALRQFSPSRRRSLRPRAWLMSIATNVWRNDLRSKSRRPVSAGRVEDAGLGWPDDQPGPEERATATVDRKALVDALATLPERYRAAVIMRHVMGLSYAEVAEAQQCAVGTVKAQVSRGLAKLREALETEDSMLKEVMT